MDKPPLGFWVQALSVKLFGLPGWALILPQALAGHQTGETFAAAAENPALAAPLRFLAGRPGMTMGGFTGVDPILAPDELSEFVGRGEVRYIPAYDSTPTTLGTVGWAAQNCGLLDWDSVPADMDRHDCGQR